MSLQRSRGLILKVLWLGSENWLTHFIPWFSISLPHQNGYWLYCYGVCKHAPLLRLAHLSWFQEPLPEDPAEQALKACHGLSQWWSFWDVGNAWDDGRTSSRPIRPIPGPSSGALARSWRCGSTTAIFRIKLPGFWWRFLGSELDPPVPPGWIPAVLPRCVLVQSLGSSTKWWYPGYATTSQNFEPLRQPFVAYFVGGNQCKTCVPAEFLDSDTHPGINRFAPRFAPGVDVVVLGIRAHWGQ